MSWQIPSYLKAGPVWDRAEIERFERGWDRRAGRPAKNA